MYVYRAAKYIDEKQVKREKNDRKKGNNCKLGVFGRILDFNITIGALDFNILVRCLETRNFVLQV